MSRIADVDGSMMSDVMSMHVSDRSVDAVMMSLPALSSNDNVIERFE